MLWWLSKIRCSNDKNFKQCIVVLSPSQVSIKSCWSQLGLETRLDSFNIYCNSSYTFHNDWKGRARFQGLGNRYSSFKLTWVSQTIPVQPPLTPSSCRSSIFNWTTVYIHYHTITLVQHIAWYHLLTHVHTHAHANTLHTHNIHLSALGVCDIAVLWQHPLILCHRAVSVIQCAMQFIHLVECNKIKTLIQ